MCAENTRWNSQEIQRGIFIYIYIHDINDVRAKVLGFARLDPRGENSIDIISITILTGDCIR